MPIYEYRCENGHEFESFQSMSDDPVSSCEECGAPVERLFSPVAIHFKGSGFYTTDYARGNGKSNASDGKPASDKKDSGDSKGSGDSKDSKKSESKSSSEGSGTKTKTDSGS